MNKRTLIKLVVAGATIFGMYKLYEAVEKDRKEREEKLKEYRKRALEEIEGELNQVEQWYDNVKNLTLNNEKLKPSDRAYAYELYKEKYDAILKANSEVAIDAARKDLEEFLRLITETKDPETIETMFKIYSDRKAMEEKLRAEKAAIDADLEKNKAIVNAIEKIGTKVVCGLVQ